MKTKNSTINKFNSLDELSPESRPTLVFGSNRKPWKTKLIKAKLLEQFGIQV